MRTRKFEITFIVEVDATVLVPDAEADVAELVRSVWDQETAPTDAGISDAYNWTATEIE